MSLGCGVSLECTHLDAMIPAKLVGLGRAHDEPALASRPLVLHHVAPDLVEALSICCLRLGLSHEVDCGAGDGEEDGAYGEDRGRHLDV